MREPVDFGKVSGMGYESVVFAYTLPDAERRFHDMFIRFSSHQGGRQNPIRLVPVCRMSRLSWSVEQAGAVNRVPLWVKVWKSFLEDFEDSTPDLCPFVYWI